MKYNKKILENGLRMITVPMQDTQTVTFLVIVGVGSRYESDKIAGISHFAEHMFFKGTKKRPTAMHIAEELDAIGGEFNAFTGKEFTGYYAKVDAKHAKVAMDVISDIFLNSKIDAEELEKEKGAIIQEIAMYEDTPIKKIGELFEELLYEGNPLGRDIAGSKETVSATTRKDMVDYIKKHYLAKNTVVCVSGNFDEEKTVKEVEKLFAKMADERKPSFKKVKEAQKKPHVKIKYKETDQTHLVVGVRAYDVFDEKRYPLSLLSVILGGNMSSRLFSEVREKRGLAYYVKAAPDYAQDCGYFAAQAGVEHKNLKKTVEIIVKEFKKIFEKGITKKELQKAKDYLKGKTIMGLESSDDWAHYIADQEIIKNKVIMPEEVFEKIDKLQAEDVQKIAQEIFKPSRINLAVIGPHEDKGFEDILKKVE